MRDEGKEGRGFHRFGLLVCRGGLAEGWSAAGESKHALDVPGHGDEGPLAFDLVETAQQELPEAHHRLDDAEHRFGGLLAQAVGSSLSDSDLSGAGAGSAKRSRQDG